MATRWPAAEAAPAVAAGAVAARPWQAESGVAGVAAGPAGSAGRRPPRREVESSVWGPTPVGEGMAVKAAMPARSGRPRPVVPAGMVVQRDRLPAVGFS